MTLRARTTIYGPDAVKHTRVAETRQYSSNLYRFTRKQERLIESLEMKALIPRYVSEDFSYLDMDISKLAFPMICFCDIPLVPDRISGHMERYGNYGIGFKKQWGIVHRLCPVHYIVEGSPFSDALFGAADMYGGLEELSQHVPYSATQQLGLAILMYAKPLQGPDDKSSDRLYCYQDECEWRYIPYHIKLPAAYLRPSELENMDDYQGKLVECKQSHLEFAYSDIEVLIAHDEAGKSRFDEAIDGFDCSEEEKSGLKARVKII